MRVDVVVFPGVDDLDVFGPVRVLRGAGFDLRLVARGEPEPVPTSSGVPFLPDARYAPGADVLLVPGGGWGARAETGAWGEARRGDWLPILREARPEVLAGVCTGTMLLAHAGRVRGRRANTHHAATAELAELGAEVVDERVVDDGDLVTSGGVTSGIDLALWLVERIAGRERADAVAANLEYARHTPAS
ncbi:DJ-1/PfpI family protein [Prauserella cavernicola]|uniref:DJ-1/PfpI family protein n=1 Tax=Prauserella cavernicola TaxID=2800127 RepID=A0A934QPV8_9PSEU|nr:DJ-1/PfpI family protein [Prauserella cavernicola]MBK1783544.1 DJ-1/PfpI family protein [Prauserella cavernicola]